MPNIPHAVQHLSRTNYDRRLDGHAGTVSIGGRPLTNLRFADDIDGLAGSEEELGELLGRLEKASKDYGMEISGEKTKKS